MMTVMPIHWHSKLTLANELDQQTVTLLTRAYYSLLLVVMIYQWPVCV